MARSHRLFAAVGISLLGLGTGCVSSEKYNGMKMKADESDQQLLAAQSNVNSAKAAGEVNERTAAQFKSMLEAKEAINANLSAENQSLRTQVADSDRRYQEAVNNLGKAGSTPLPAQLVSELSGFAQQNPDVVEFDDKKGLVKFKSDVTFSAGSGVLKPEAKVVIDRLAGILNGPAASQYELMVVGHTDSAPVSNPMTVKAGHLDNWYLSVHRAIAVSKALQSQGTSAARIEVAGRADQKPVAPNDTDVNKARNRRVEVFILPTQTGGTPAAATNTPPAAPQPPAAPAAKASVAPAAKKGPLDKDQPATPVEVERKPYLSK